MKKLAIILAGSIFLFFLSCGGEDKPASSIVEYKANSIGTINNISYKDANGVTINAGSAASSFSKIINAGKGAALFIQATDGCAGAPCPVTVQILVDGVSKASLTGNVNMPSVSVNYTIP